MSIKYVESEAIWIEVHYFEVNHIKNTIGRDLFLMILLNVRDTLNLVINAQLRMFVIF